MSALALQRSLVRCAQAAVALMISSTVWLLSPLSAIGAEAGSVVAPPSDQQPLLRPGINAATPPRFELTLTQAVDKAIKMYPSLKRVNWDIHSARHEITLAKTEYLPRMDTLYQEMRATQNVIPGTILPQFLNVIPIQSGQPHNSSTFSSIFNANAGFNFSWELIDFGLRAANVKVARQTLNKTVAQEHLTELDVASRAADGYLKFIMAQQEILAYKAILERMQAWSLVVHTLCDKGLRPGVDAARADAEVSLSKIALINAERESELAQQDLAEAMGVAGTLVEAVSAPLLVRPKTTFTANLQALDRHPLALTRLADVDIAKARLHRLDRTWYPHLWYESAIWGRGSGNRQVIQPVADGIVPKTGNWAVGLTLQFPLIEYFKVKANKSVERSTIEAKRANYDLAMQELIKDDEKAKILLRRAQEVADETPVLINAAKENEMMARERYKVGLTNVVEVAEAERILAKAQVEDAVAQLKVWQALLATAYAHGDLKPFLALVAAAESTTNY